MIHSANTEKQLGRSLRLTENHHGVLLSKYGKTAWQFQQYDSILSETKRQKDLMVDIVRGGKGKRKKQNTIEKSETSQYTFLLDFKPTSSLRKVWSTFPQLYHCTFNPRGNWGWRNKTWRLRTGSDRETVANKSSPFFCERLFSSKSVTPLTRTIIRQKR